MTFNVDSEADVRIRWSRTDSISEGLASVAYIVLAYFPVFSSYGFDFGFRLSLSRQCMFESSALLYRSSIIALGICSFGISYCTRNVIIALLFPPNLRLRNYNQMNIMQARVRRRPKMPYSTRFSTNLVTWKTWLPSCR